MGRDEPVLATVLPDGCESFGPQVVAWARANMGSEKRPMELMPWQEIALFRQLAHVNGSLVHDEALTSTARQNGKSRGGMLPLAGWWLTERCRLFDDDDGCVILSAHKLRVASRMFRRLAAVLEDRFGAEVKWSYGREELRLPCGCEMYVEAATPQAGHSLTASLLLVDELWSVTSEAYDDGLKPTTRTVANSLVSAWSTAGTLASEVMLRFREQGLRSIDVGRPGSVCLSSWEIPVGLDPMDERLWRLANPAMGKPQSGLTLERLRRESLNPKRNAFLRPALNRWVSAEDSWLDVGVWDGLAVA